MGTDVAWIGLAGALGGVIVGGVVSIVTTILGNRSQTKLRREERSDRLREAKAQLRRDAYARFLIAAQVMGEKIETREPEDQSRPVDERLQEFRLENAVPFAEFDAAERHVRLLCGAGVIKPFEVYRQWVIDQLRISFEAGSPADSTAFAEWEESEEPLITAMRTEQERDLSLG